MQISVNYLDFLNNKTMYYDKINYDVIASAWNILLPYINLPYVIHIVGTNGKGSTGRYIASFIHQLDKKVLHYSSPHILEFNERIWINGKNSNYDELQFSHIFLHNNLNKELLEKLTYFEYTTLMAIVLSNNFDYIVIEAGLGGEFDATNVIENNLSVIPSIGIDHIEFLGNTIEKIARTKLKSCNNAYIFGLNMDTKVEKIRKEILFDKKQINIDLTIKLPNKSKSIANYLKNNLILAMNVLKYLNLNTKKLVLPELFSRFEKINKNITVDVGHNLLAAKEIKKEYLNNKINLIYNTFKDKDYIDILKCLKPIINKVEIVKCNDKRMVDTQILIKQCDKLNIKVSMFKYENMKKEDNYLVFGSFRVVEQFLNEKEIYEK